MIHLRPHNTDKLHRVNAGFTLIELMIVVAIVGILSAIALPAYTQYVMRGRLTEAAATLAGHRVKMEQFYQDARTYTGSCVAGTVAPLPPATANFTFACVIAAAPGQSYDVTATGIAGTSMAGFVLGIDETNARYTTSVPTGWVAPANCWVTKKSGQC